MRRTIGIWHGLTSVLVLCETVEMDDVMEEDVLLKVRAEVVQMEDATP